MAMQTYTVFFLIDRLDDMSMIVATRRLLDAEISVFEAFPQSVANKGAIFQVDYR